MIDNLEDISSRNLTINLPSLEFDTQNFCGRAGP